MNTCIYIAPVKQKSSKARTNGMSGMSCRLFWSWFHVNWLMFHKHMRKICTKIIFTFSFPVTSTFHLLTSDFLSSYCQEPTIRFK